MDSTKIRQSHKHPNLCTLIVDGYDSHDGGKVSAHQPEHYWRLPNTDPRNEGKYLFRLHTLDIYFWKPEDAHTFMAAAKNILQAGQLEVLDAPSNPAPHEQVMSPVVRQLENVAIQDPAYRNGQTRNSRTTSFAGASSPNDRVPQTTAEQGTPKAQEPSNFQPLAYNPAAPAAPEPIKHREKTPPPIDAEEGTGLAGAAYRDHSASMSPQSSLSRPPYGQAPHSQVSSVVSLAPTAGYSNSMPSVPGQRASSVSSFPPPPPHSGRGSVSPYTPTPSFAPPPQNSPHIVTEQSQQIVPSFSAPPQDHAPFYSTDTNPPESPATEILGDSYVSGVRQPLQHLHPQYANYNPSATAEEKPAPIGGYSDYQYTQQQPHHHHHHHHHQSPSKEYDVHNQVYRPTLEEASKKKSSKTFSAAPSEPAGRLEQNTGKVDKKVNSFFKKLEKKIG